MAEEKVEKLTDEELDMVTGGNNAECNLLQKELGTDNVDELTALAQKAFGTKRVKLRIDHQVSTSYDHCPNVFVVKNQIIGQAEFINTLKRYKFLEFMKTLKHL